MLADWGLVPHFVTHQTDANTYAKKCLNAVGETISQKNAFKNALPCLVPITGFYEWQTKNSEKHPYYIYMAQQKWFYLAGLYAIRKPTPSTWQLSYAIVTTRANALMEEIHNEKKRMPVYLTQEQAAIWLFTKDLEQFIAKTEYQTLHAHGIKPNKKLSREPYNPQQLSLF